MIKARGVSKCKNSLKCACMLLAAAVILTGNLLIWGDTTKSEFDEDVVNRYLKRSVETYQIPGLSAVIIRKDQVVFMKNTLCGAT